MGGRDGALKVQKIPNIPQFVLCCLHEVQDASSQLPAPAGMCAACCHAPLAAGDHNPGTVSLNGLP